MNWKCIKVSMCVGVCGVVWWCGVCGVVRVVGGVGVCGGQVGQVVVCSEGQWDPPKKGKNRHRRFKSGRYTNVAGTRQGRAGR